MAQSKGSAREFERETLSDGGVEWVIRLSVDGEGRTEYGWGVRDGELSVSGRDLRTGVGLDDGPRAMLAALCGFLGAFAESRRYGSPDSDNWGLFPDSLAEWATAHDDEVTLLGLDIEESGS
jgi:hypothetical protein